MNTPSTAVNEQDSTINATPSKPILSQPDDGSKQLSWILIVVMVLFATLTVASYQEKSTAENTPSAKQSETIWKKPKQVSAPESNSNKGGTQDTELKPEEMGRGELISA